MLLIEKGSKGMPHHLVVVTSTAGKKRMFYWSCKDSLLETYPCSCIGPTKEFLLGLSRRKSTASVVYLICGVEVEAYHREPINGELVQ